MAWELKISGIVSESIVDGPGIRYVIFTQGCPHHCKGCHNPQTHDFQGGEMADWETVLQAVKENPLLGGVTFSGGEPFAQAEPLADLARELKRLGKHLMVYTGYTYEELLQRKGQRPAIGELLSQADILVDGPYVEAERDLTLKFRGSANQRVIDLVKTRDSGTVVLYQEEY